MNATPPDRPREAGAELLADRYALGEVIGRGRSIVHRAEDVRLRRPVAVKQVQLVDGVEDAQGTRSRAMREAHAAARLSNPRAVTVFDVFEEQGSVWLVMELVDAPSLSALVADEGQLDHPRAARIGLDVLDALVAAHAVGVVHRDVKPANVMVTDDDRAKLTDFGVARIRDDAHVTATGLIIGSPAYMAPEQAKADRAGPPADLWALGATLYYAVEGTSPFPGTSAIAVATAVVFGRHRRPERLGSLTELIERLLTKDAAERPTPGEIRRGLRAAAGYGPPAPRPAAGWPGVAAGRVVGPAASSAAASLASAASRLTSGARRRRRGSGEAARTQRLPGPVADPGDPVMSADAPPAGSASSGDVPGEAASASGADTTRGDASGEAAPASGRDVGGGDRPAPDGDAHDGGEPTPGGDTGRTSAPAPAGVPARRPRAMLVVVLVAVVVLAGAVLATRSGSGGDAGQRSGAGPSTTATGPPEGTDDDPAGGTTTPSVPPTSTPTTATVSGAAVPEGWTPYTDPDGAYTIAHPPGWQVEPGGRPRTAYVRAPESGSYLLVEWTDAPRPDPVADWRHQAQSFAGRHQGYQELRIEPTAYRAYDAAVWEFRYDDGGVQLHVANLGFVAAGRGYALYFQTHEPNWASSQDTLAGFRAAFSPTG